MAFTIDYSTTDANYWRAVVTSGAGVRVLAVEVRRAGSGITRGQALNALTVMVRALRPRISTDELSALLRSIEAEGING